MMGARTGVIAVCAVLLASQTGGGWHPLKSKNGKVKKGNKKFSGEKYVDALEAYDKAALQLPEEAGVHYNRGAALFKQGTSGDEPDQDMLDRAAKAFSDAIGLAGEQDQDFKADAFYNMGNVRFAQERWEEAIAAYRQALKMRPGFEDAAYNLALALKKLEEQRKKEQEEKKEKEQQEKEQQEKEQQEQKEQEDDEQCDQGQQEKDKQKEQSDQGQQEKDQQKEQSDQGQQENKQQQEEKDKQGAGEQQQKKKQQQQQQQQKQQQDMSEPVPVTKQEAEAILDALQRGEKNLKLEQMEQQQGQGYGKPEVDKDW